MAGVICFGDRRERDGWRVTYQGIIAGLDDLGRDLLCFADGDIEVVQCKWLAMHKTIHEKHVFQLFGTVVAARSEYPDAGVFGTFVTTTTLSDRAHEFASNSTSPSKSKCRWRTIRGSSATSRETLASGSTTCR
ncbi:MAG TPA: restriction endonuclease [Solirubrobacteraceae bacterium]|nr:restriction endonuclease [Solirubrobacteraceae bacterium]